MLEFRCVLSTNCKTPVERNYRQQFFDDIELKLAPFFGLLRYNRYHFTLFLFLHFVGHSRRLQTESGKASDFSDGFKLRAARLRTSPTGSRCERQGLRSSWRVLAHSGKLSEVLGGFSLTAGNFLKFLEGSRCERQGF